MGPIGRQLEETIITGWNELEARDWGNNQVDDAFSAKGDSYICDVHALISDFPDDSKVKW